MFVIFTYTELKASDNNEVHMSFPNCESSVQNFLHMALGRLDFAGSFKIFGKCVDSWDNYISSFRGREVGKWMDGWMDV